LANDNDKAKVEATLRLIVDTTVGIYIDIRRIMFVFDWFIVKIADPNFAWMDFTRAVYLADTRARSVAKTAKTRTPSVITNTPASSTIDFYVDVLLVDAKRQATPPTPRTTGTLKSHKIWKSPFAAVSRNSSNARQLYNTELVLASSKPLDVIEFYRKLIAVTKPAEIDLIPFMNCCAGIVFEMNDALVLHLDQTGTLNLDDETINILYQKHIIDSTSGIHAYAFLRALLKKAKQKLNECMPTPPDIEQATSIGSFGVNMERYYLQLSTIGVTFEDKTKSLFFLSALQQKNIEVDIFDDRLDNVADADPLPDELTLAELIMCIKDICSLQNSSVAVINRPSRDTQRNDTSTPRYPCPPRHHNNDCQANTDVIRRTVTSDPHTNFGHARTRNVFLAIGATLLRAVNNWQCIFSYPDIFRMINMSPHPGRYQNAGGSLTRNIRAQHAQQYVSFAR
jgi:hypothetical protein